MANKNDPWYNWLNPAYAYGQYYNAAQNGTGLANRVSRTAGALGGNDPLQMFYGAKEGNVGDVAMGGLGTAWDLTLGKAALGGKLIGKGGSIIGKEIGKRVPGQTFMRTLIGTNPVEGAKYPGITKIGNYVNRSLSAIGLPMLGIDIANAATGKQEPTVRPTVKPTQTKTPTVLTSTAPDFSKMTQAEKLDWIAKNDILSPNFQQVYQQENPQGAMALAMMQLTDPQAEEGYKQTVALENARYSLLDKQLKAAKKAGNIQYKKQQEGIGAETSGQNLNLRAALAATGGLTSPGLYGLGQESYMAQGRRALDQLAQQKALADQNIAAQRGDADLARRKALSEAALQKAEAKKAYLDMWAQRYYDQKRGQ